MSTAFPRSHLIHPYVAQLAKPNENRSNEWGEITDYRLIESAPIEMLPVAPSRAVANSEDLEAKEFAYET